MAAQTRPPTSLLASQPAGQEARLSARVGIGHGTVGPCCASAGAWVLLLSRHNFGFRLVLMQQRIFQQGNNQSPIHLGIVMSKILLAVLCVLSLSASAATPPELALQFRRDVARRLDIPPEAEKAYLRLALDGLGVGKADLVRQQMVVVVDRNPHVQALMIFGGSSGSGWQLIGGAPVSTGSGSGFDHYISPVGVFDHLPDGYDDYRAAGSFNSNGIRGFGRTGMRVWDFGWHTAEKGWLKGRTETGAIRFLMHATDPDRLEGRLGTAASKGCIRIGAQVNTFLDRYGALDYHYRQRLGRGERSWVVRPDAVDTGMSGRYLVVLDSGSVRRPDWVAARQAEANGASKRGKKGRRLDPQGPEPVRKVTQPGKGTEPVPVASGVSA